VKIRDKKKVKKMRIFLKKKKPYIVCYRCIFREIWY